MARRRRPVMTTKEELLEYLLANTDTELPFNSEVWDRAVDATLDKERQFKEIQTTGFNGDTKTKKIPNGSVNPVGKYFQLIALPQYSKPVISEDDIDEDILDDEYFDDSEKAEVVSEWISVFFDGYDAGDKKFLRERLGDYYENYELNEGADKFQAVKAVMDELEIRNLTKLRAKNKDVEARIEKVQKGYLSLLDSLKALKKQRGAGDDEGKNKFTLFVDDLEKEGKLIVKKDDSYTPDDIDRMLDNWENSMRTVLTDG